MHKFNLARLFLTALCATLTGCGDAPSKPITATVSDHSSVQVSAPANNSTVSSPVRFVATATTTCSSGVSAMGIYTALGVLAYRVNGATLNTQLALNPGSHNTVVEEWDSCGGTATTPINITVASGSSGSGSSVQVLSPANNSAVTSPVNFVARATTSCAQGVASMGIYTAPGVLAYSVDGASLNTNLSLNPGTYNIVVQEWDNCGSAANTPLTVTVNGGAGAGGVPPSGHVFLVVEENHQFSDVIGSSAMPYLNNLANQYGLALAYYANTHPSIGNYFMLTTGQIITNSDSFCGTVAQDNIVRHLVASGKSWKSYAESLPGVGYAGCDLYPYLKRHNPFSYFTDVVNSASQQLNLVDFSQFAADLANNQLPEFSFIVPNALDDAHDGTLQQADSWLSNNIAPLIASPVFQKDGILIIVFDEAETADIQGGGGHVAAVVLGPKVLRGHQSAITYQHQNTLKTLMEALGLTSFPGAASGAQDMADFF